MTKFKYDNLLPVRNKYIAKNEVGNQLNIFVFESGIWTNVAGVEFIVPSELGMATVGHGRSSVGHDRSEAFDRPTVLTDRLV